MSQDLPTPKLAEREKNFFNGVLPTTIEGKIYYYKLQDLAARIETEIESVSGTSYKQILEIVFSCVYNFTISQNAQQLYGNALDYSLFDENMAIYADTFEACFFISLCMFLHETKRLEGCPDGEFIYKNSPNRYNVNGSPNYFDYEYTKRNAVIRKTFNQDGAKLRKFRHRLLSERSVYHPSHEWFAMRKSSWHEWLLYFLDENEDLVDRRMDEETKKKIKENQQKKSKIKDTRKRIGNLYHGLNTALTATMDSEYVANLEDAYEKFLSKLKKIKYEDYLQLNKFFIEHIQKDSTFYGINLYRLEKELRLCNVTRETKHMLNCKSEDEENDALEKFFLLHSIPFPKLYEYFYKLGDYKSIQIYANTFVAFMNELVNSSRLIIDKFIEEGLFGEDWGAVFTKTVNEFAESVLYDPEKIDYSVTPESQELFMKVICNPAYRVVMRRLEIAQRMTIDSDDDEI